MSPIISLHHQLLPFTWNSQYEKVTMNWFAWALLSAFFAGATAILAKIGVAGVNSNLATAIRTTVVLLFTWAIALSTTQVSAARDLPPRTWLFLALSGLATGLSWLCYFRALQLGEASRVAPVDKLSVVFVIVFAALLLKENMTWQHWVGGALVTGGAVLLAWK
jgi:transporter family protein